MADKLKPCPFCGSKDLDIDSNNESYYVHCWGCRADGGNTDTIDEAIDRWNRRAEVKNDG